MYSRLGILLFKNHCVMSVCTIKSVWAFAQNDMDGSLKHNASQVKKLTGLSRILQDLINIKISLKYTAYIFGRFLQDRQWSRLDPNNSWLGTSRIKIILRSSMKTFHEDLWKLCQGCSPHALAILFFQSYRNVMCHPQTVCSWEDIFFYLYKQVL